MTIKADLDAEVFTWITQEEAAALPPNFQIVQVIRDAWWGVDAEGRVAYYPRRGHRNMVIKGNPRYGSPQCNPHRSIAERLVSEERAFVGVVQIPLAFKFIDVRDY